MSWVSLAMSLFLSTREVFMVASWLVRFSAFLWQPKTLLRDMCLRSIYLDTLHLKFRLDILDCVRQPGLQPVSGAGLLRDTGGTPGTGVYIFILLSWQIKAGQGAVLAELDQAQEQLNCIEVKASKFLIEHLFNNKCFNQRRNTLRFSALDLCFTAKCYFF